MREATNMENEASEKCVAHLAIGQVAPQGRCSQFSARAAHARAPSVNLVSGTCCCSRLCSIERRLNGTVVLRQFSRQRDWECFLHIPQTIALNICRAEEASPGMPAESGRH